MKNESSRSSRYLLDKFDTLHDAFVQLNEEAADFQRELNLSDTTTRGQLDALSRTLAFCDQMHMVLTLMREDIRSLEPHGDGHDPFAWTDQLDECLEDWLRSACQANPTVH